MDARDSDAVDSGGRVTAYGSRRPISSGIRNNPVGYDAARYAAPSTSSSSSREVVPNEEFHLELTANKFLSFSLGEKQDTDRSQDL